MDLTGESDSPSPGGATVLVGSAPCQSPSLSPSSPDSLSNSLLSSFAADSSLGVNHVTNQTRGKRNMASTFGPRAKSPPTPPSPDITSSDSCLRTVAQTSLADKKPCRTADDFDSFPPSGFTKMKVREGEKYDPFDPTVSPGSDADGRNVKVKSRGAHKKKAKKPADSTQSSTCPLLSGAPWWRADGSDGKRGRRRDADDSDHSEIEEGEIVVADRREGNDRATAASPAPFCVSKPERILRVLDGDGFVSVHTEGDDAWEVRDEPEDEPVVGVEDLRNKLLSRQKERFSCLPALAPLSLPPLHLPSHSSTGASSRLSPLVGDATKNPTFKGSEDGDLQKNTDRKAGERREKKTKRKKDKGGQERSKDKERGKKEDKKTRSRHSSSGATKKKSHGKEASKAGKTSHKRDHNGHSSSSQYEDRDADRGRSQVKDRSREGYKDRDRPRRRERSREADRRQSGNSGHRRHVGGGPSASPKDKERKERNPSSSRKAERRSKRSKSSREKRESRSDGHGEREKRRDGRPVIPPSIQDLSGSDLFAIKRTITVTTTTTTTTAVPGSPGLALTSYGRPAQESNRQQHSRNKKRKWLSGEEVDGKESCRSRSQSLSPQRYRSYESEHYSDKFEIDVLSLDGEALDSDYQLLDDTPPAGLPPDPEVPHAPQTKSAPKTARRHQKKKLKEVDQYETSSLSSSKSKTKHLSSLKVTSGSASASGLSGLPSLKRTRKMRKNKEQDKSCRKDLARSGKSKKEDGGNRKGKLQSKVSVLVRDGVSSTTGGKPGMDLLGSAGASGASVVGDSIAVVFCRDNESRSPFLKPCSEPLSSAARNKDLAGLEKRSRLAAPLPSLSSPAGGLKSKKTKPSSITSTSSSASSPSLILTTKRGRRPAKKSKVKAGASGSTDAAVNSQTKVSSETWDRPPSDVQSGNGDANDSASPRTGQTGVAPGSSSSSSSSSTSSSSSSNNALAPSSSPHRTPPPATVASRDARARESSSPDSQTVDSSCKTPETSFLADEGPTQTSPRPPGPATSPSSSSNAQGGAHGGAASAPNARSPPAVEEAKASGSPSNLSSSTGCDLSSFSSLPKTSSDPSASVSSSSVGKPFVPLPSPFPWNLQTGVDCATGGVLALTALLFKMEEANIANRAKAHEFLQATNQILSKANQNQNQNQSQGQNQSQQHLPTTPSASSSSSSSSSSQVPLPPVLPPPPRLSPAQFLLHGSLPLVGCTKTPPSLLQQPSVGGAGLLQTPSSVVPLVLPGGTASCGDAGWDGESKDPDKYMKKLHTQERAVEEVKLAIKPYYQRKDITKDEYKDILRKAVHKICHSRTGEINPVKVSNLVKLYVQRYKYFRKHGRRVDEEERDDKELLHYSS